MPRSDKPTGAVWRVLDAWADRQEKADPFGRRPTQGEMAEAFDVGGSIITHWKQMTSRMQVKDMVKIAARTDIKYADLSRALAEDEPHLAAHMARRLEEKLADHAARKMRERGTA